MIALEVCNGEDGEIYGGVCAQTVEVEGMC